MLMGASRLRSPPLFSAPLRRIQATALYREQAHELLHRHRFQPGLVGAEMVESGAFLRREFAGDGGLSPRVAASAMSPPVNI